MTKKRTSDLKEIEKLIEESAKKIIAKRKEKVEFS